MEQEAGTAPEPTPGGTGPSEGAGQARTDGARRKKKKSGRTARNAQYWMLVSSPENFRKTRDHGFAIQGVKSRHRKRVETMRSGDRLLYYVTGRMGFAAAVTLTSSMYEDHQPIWRTARREEDYPWRVRIRLDSVLDDVDFVLAKDVAFRMEYVRKWPPEHWTLAFQGHLHQLPQKDFKLIEDELRRARSRASARNRTGGGARTAPSPVGEMRMERRPEDAEGE